MVTSAFEFRILNSELYVSASLGFRDLFHASLMPSAGERRRQPQRQNFFGETKRNDPAAHREHVGIVVFARQPRCVQIVAECRANSLNFVGGDLLALAAAAQDDAARPAATALPTATQIGG
jgi:hypothetical protein